jgi:poly(3-hydroxybutyrate) depolymerase
MRMRTAMMWLLLACAPVGTGRAAADDAPAGWPWPYDPGESTEAIEQMKVTLYVPRRLTPQSGSSLLVLLHGARARGDRLATFFRFWPRRNYVVCAPQASGAVWRPDDLARVRRIIKTLQAKLPIDPNRLHVAGFSNGASNLHTLAFADDLKAVSGTWVGGGVPAVPVPPWARTRFGALFMAGEHDFALPRVRQGPTTLAGRVRSVELFVEPDVAHTWPTSRIEYHLWWMGVQEGRYRPGYDGNFAWGDDLGEALAAVKRGEAPGAFLYLYDTREDARNAASKALQNHTFMDPVIRRLGARLVAVKVDKTENTASLARLGVPALATPAVVVFGPDGRPVKTLSGAIEPAALRAALARVAGERPVPGTR